MRIVPMTAVALLLGVFAAFALTTAPHQPAPGQPAAQQPPPGAPQQPSPVTPPGPVSAPVVPPPPLGARTFTANTGMILQTVRPERVADFETVIGYLQAALEKSTDPAVRAQAQGWRVYKATELGPNSTVLYVFLIDPAVAGADYGLGRILADAYPEKIQELWKLYTGALGPSANLLNLLPVDGPPPVPAASSPAPSPSIRPEPPPAGRGGTQPSGRGTFPAPGRGTPGSGAELQ